MITRFFEEYRFLSNFWPCTIEYEGLTYPSVEHAYQAAKVKGNEIRKLFLNIPPGEAKRLGREVMTQQYKLLRDVVDKVERRENWHETKVSIMWELLQIKFKDKHLAQKLLNTHPETLIEGNTWGDTFWGQCDGKGENMLGKLLVEVRNQLRENEKRT